MATLSSLAAPNSGKVDIKTILSGFNEIHIPGKMVFILKQASECPQKLSRAGGLCVCGAGRWQPLPWLQDLELGPGAIVLVLETVWGGIVRARQGLRCESVRAHLAHLAAVGGDARGHLVRRHDRKLHGCQVVHLAVVGTMSIIQRVLGAVSGRLRLRRRTGHAVTGTGPLHTAHRSCVHEVTHGRDRGRAPDGAGVP